MATLTAGGRANGHARHQSSAGVPSEWSPGVRGCAPEPVVPSQRKLTGCAAAHKALISGPPAGDHSSPWQQKARPRAGLQQAEESERERAAQERKVAQPPRSPETKMGERT